MIELIKKWKKIKGWPYEISAQGRVRSLYFNKILTCKKRTNGYPTVVLYNKNKKVYRRIHILVAEAFLGKRPKNMDTRHLDGDKENNFIYNLAYGTRSENVRDAMRHGTHSPPLVFYGKNHWTHKNKKKKRVQC